MVTIAGIEYESSFGAVSFAAGAQQSFPRKTDFAEETIVGGAVTGTTYVYRDWYALPPDVLDLSILLPDVATFHALADLRGYPVANGGVPYELMIPGQAIHWTATLDELTQQAAYRTDTPFLARAVFTRIADIVAPSVPGIPPVAGFVFGTDGLDAVFDANSSSAVDGFIDTVNWEFGDGNIATQTGPWATGAANIPTQAHTYALPGVYVVTASVVRNAVISDDFSTLVTVP